MSLNEFMHQRNPFRGKKIDFRNLALKYDFLKTAICANSDINDEIAVDFKSAAHLSAISRALLLEYFNLTVTMPLDRLIPTIPLRMNYILWIEDLLTCVTIGGGGGVVNVLDVGAGASCIYGLLGARIHSWRFLASEIDEDNFNWAKLNVEENNLSDLIKVVAVPPQTASDKSILQPLLQTEFGNTYFNVMMCNPPFFGSVFEKSGAVGGGERGSRDGAKSVNCSNRNESIVEGGEAEFTKRLIDDSLIYKDKIGIFTVMLGKKSSCDIVKHYLQSMDISNYSIYEMCQGRVMRWGVAWSFLPQFIHPKSEFKLSKPTRKRVISWMLNCELFKGDEYSVNGVYNMLKNICKTLELSYLEQRNKQSKGGGVHLLVTAKKDTWSHQRKKRRELLRLAKKHDNNNSNNKEEKDRVDGEPELKRRKINIGDICGESGVMDDGSGVGETESQMSVGSIDECLIKCTINVVIVVEKDVPSLRLDMKYLEGDKEAMNQILTYIKNHCK